MSYYYMSGVAYAADTLASHASVRVSLSPMRFSLSTSNGHEICAQTKHLSVLLITRTHHTHIEPSNTLEAAAAAAAASTVLNAQRHKYNGLTTFSFCKLCGTVSGNLFIFLFVDDVDFSLRLFFIFFFFFLSRSFLSPVYVCYPELNFNLLLYSISSSSSSSLLAPSPPSLSTTFITMRNTVPIPVTHTIDSTTHPRRATHTHTCALYLCIGRSAMCEERLPNQIQFELCGRCSVLHVRYATMDGVSTRTQVKWERKEKKRQHFWCLERRAAIWCVPNGHFYVRQLGKNTLSHTHTRAVYGLCVRSTKEILQQILRRLQLLLQQANGCVCVCSNQPSLADGCWHRHELASPSPQMKIFVFFLLVVRLFSAPSASTRKTNPFTRRFRFFGFVFKSHLRRLHRAMRQHVIKANHSHKTNSDCDSRPKTLV